MAVSEVDSVSVERINEDMQITEGMYARIHTASNQRGVFKWSPVEKCEGVRFCLLRVLAKPLRGFAVLGSSCFVSFAFKVFDVFHAA